MSVEPEFKYASVDRDEFIGQWVDWVMENQAWPISEDNARRYITYVVENTPNLDNDVEWQGELEFQIKRMVKLGATDLIGPILHEAVNRGIEDLSQLLNFGYGVVDKLAAYNLKKGIADPKIPRGSFWPMLEGKKMEDSLSPSTAKNTIWVTNNLKKWKRSIGP